jgi:hypothetical protein
MSKHKTAVVPNWKRITGTSFLFAIVGGSAAAMSSSAELFGGGKVLGAVCSCGGSDGGYTVDSSSTYDYGYCEIYNYDMSQHPNKKCLSGTSAKGANAKSCKKICDSYNKQQSDIKAYKENPEKFVAETIAKDAKAEADKAQEAAKKAADAAKKSGSAKDKAKARELAETAKELLNVATEKQEYADNLGSSTTASSDKTVPVAGSGEQKSENKGIVDTVKKAVKKVVKKVITVQPI